jgi:BASS family bile acid:Na+ symporter
MKVDKNTISNLLKNQNYVLFLAFFLGIFLSKFAIHTKNITIPALIAVMTISSIEISLKDFFPLSKIARPVLIGIISNYIILSVVILSLAWFLVPDQELWEGFVIVAVSPPAVLIIPFTKIFKGNISLSITGTFGTYFAAIIIAPLVAFLLLGENLINPLKLIIILFELIIIPLILSRLLLLKYNIKNIEKYQSPIVNIGLFIVFYTVVGLNRQALLGEPKMIGMISIIAFSSFFILKFFIEFILNKLKVSKKTQISIILMGTIKNTGFAAVTALSLFGAKAAIPPAVFSVFIVIYLIYLGISFRI